MDAWFFIGCVVILAIMAGIGVFLLNFGTDGYRAIHCVAVVLGFFAVAVSLISSVFYIPVAYSSIAAKHKARIINAEYGTNYTAQDIFWASDVIDTIREIKRNRTEVNGSIRIEHSGSGQDSE